MDIMITIKLTQEAYACGGSIRAGGNSVHELAEWYEAAAEDADGNEYRVIWEISNPDAEDEGDACDWSEPWAILDEHYNNVSDTVTLDGDK
jgi:hypothetical protein